MNKQRGDSAIAIMAFVIIMMCLFSYCAMLDKKDCNGWEKYPKSVIPVRCYKELGL